MKKYVENEMRISKQYFLKIHKSRYYTVCRNTVENSENLAVASKSNCYLLQGTTKLIMMVFPFQVQGRRKILRIIFMIFLLRDMDRFLTRSRSEICNMYKFTCTPCHYYVFMSSGYVGYLALSSFGNDFSTE